MKQTKHKLKLISHKLRVTYDTVYRGLATVGIEYVEHVFDFALHLNGGTQN